MEQEIAVKAEVVQTKKSKNERRFGTIEHKVNLSSERIASLDKLLKEKTTSIEKSHRAINDRIDEIDTKVLMKFLRRTTSLVEGLETRVSELDKMYHFMIHKETILTEVSMYARSLGDWSMLAQFHLAIMKAYNQENEWWHDSQEMTIKRWFKKIMDLYNEPELLGSQISREINL